MINVIGVDCPGGEIDGAMELFDFITGADKFKVFGNGMHTYPRRDANNQRIYDICLQLEAKGLIGRGIDEPGHVFWVAKGEP